MKAVIHIGMPKTGSRSIQVWMRSNWDALNAVGARTFFAPVPLLLMASIHAATIEHGIDEKIAWQGWEGKPGARKLGLEVDEKTNWRTIAEQKRARAKKTEAYYKFLIGKLEQISKESGVFFWSDERLYDKKNLISPLDKILARFFDDRIYVMYIRNTVDYFVSKYSQDLRDCDENFGTMKFSEFLENCSKRTTFQDEGLPLENLFSWRKLIGERLNVRLAEHDWLVNGDLIEDFSSVIGVDAFRKPDRKNESFAAEYIEYVRYLNRRFGRSLPDDIRIDVLNFLTNASSGKPKLTASVEQAGSILDLHRELEERVREKFFPERPFLFSQKLRKQGVMPSSLTNCRIAKIESEISEALRMDWDPYVITQSEGRK